MLHEIVCAQPFVCRLVCNIHKHPYVALVLDIQDRGVEIYQDPLQLLVVDVVVTGRTAN